MKTWKIILLLIIFLLSACGAPALESEPSPEALRSTATAEDVVG